jgi:hypothetical protein
MYNSKKMVGKKIGQFIEKVGECTVIDAMDQFFLIERTFVLKREKMFIKVHILQNHPFTASSRLIKLRELSF